MCCRACCPVASAACSHAKCISARALYQAINEPRLRATMKHTLGPCLCEGHHLWAACHLSQLRAGAHCARCSAGRAGWQSCSGFGDPIRCLCQLVDTGEPCSRLCLIMPGLVQFLASMPRLSTCFTRCSAGNGDTLTGPGTPVLSISICCKAVCLRVPALSAVQPLCCRACRQAVMLATWAMPVAPVW